MQFYSTNNKNLHVSFEEAIFTGLSKDGGLYMPEKIPLVTKNFINSLSSKTFPEIAYDIASFFLGDDIPKNELRKIVSQAFTFEVPLVKLTPNLFVLELFHGPTLAFKDIGARFMARIFSHFTNRIKKQITILVATSGDTGAAVAAGFFNLPNIRVILLYPKGRVSHEQQDLLTKWDGNITVIELNGTFDDCQRYIKQAFTDNSIRKNQILTSANSINIARLLPQVFYYFWAYAKIKNKKGKVIFSVPCGNFGNLTAGLVAKKMGLPIDLFIAATNANNVFPAYLYSGKYRPKPSKQTISNAMDVGNPNNFARIMDLYKNNLAQLKKDIWSQSFSDEQTRDAIKEAYQKYNYILDPHGAVAYLGIQAYKKSHKENFIGVFLETAHPAKFKNIIEDTLQISIPTPDKLLEFTKRKRQAITIPNSYNALKRYIDR